MSNDPHSKSGGGTETPLHAVFFAARATRPRCLGIAKLASISLALLTPAAALALDNCEAKYSRRNGVLRVSASSVDGPLRMAFSAQADPETIPAERCTTNGGTVRCSLSDAGQLPPLSPPADCTARLTDDSQACVAYVRGCVPGERQVNPCIRVSQDGKDIVYQGCNVHIRNTAGTTVTADGTGNLIIGWNENSLAPLQRTGSHNLVVGDNHSWTSTGGIVAGYANSIVGVSASVLGGTENVAMGQQSAVLGGEQNATTGVHSTISGGLLSEAKGRGSTVSGGVGGFALGPKAAVGGGILNSASGENSFVAGGSGNVASGYAATTTGGSQNEAVGNGSTATGGISNVAESGAALVAGGQSNRAGTSDAMASTVVGGSFNTALGDDAAVFGGSENVASAPESSVSGGHKNSADGVYSSVSGGEDRSVSDYADWAAGSLLEDD